MTRVTVQAWNPWLQGFWVSGSAQRRQLDQDRRREAAGKSLAAGSPGAPRLARSQLTVRRAFRCTICTCPSQPC